MLSLSKGLPSATPFFAFMVVSITVQSANHALHTANLYFGTGEVVMNIVVLYFYFMVKIKYLNHIFIKLDKVKNTE